MSVIGAGIDIIETNRISSMCKKYGDHFLHKIYTLDELILNNSASFLSGRWAAKEAVLKVLGTGLSNGINWKDINITQNQQGMPVVVLQNKAAEEAQKLGIKKILVSITHSDKLAAAVAIGTD